MAETPPPWVVTGATRGIGLATATALAEAGETVLLVGRDRVRLDRAAEQVRRSGPVAGTVVADLATRPGVRAAAAEIRGAHPILRGLVNNAGGIFVRREVNADGDERTFALNVLAPFALTQLLGEALAEGHGRVVNIASAAHHGASVDFDDLDGTRYTAWSAYSRSKLELILLTAAFARRRPPETTAYFAVHPGFVRSGFGINNGGGFAFGMRIAMTIGGISPRRAARTVLYAARSPELTGRSGLYVARQHVTTPSAAAGRAADGERLWEAVSRRLGMATGAGAGAVATTTA